jgi:Tfp pilus assembly major pilin PilA
MYHEVKTMKGGKMKGIKGFTLIEFVLWAAVAAGLAAIALPAVQ